MQHFFLQRNVDALIGIAGGLVFVIERPHERVGEEYPWEALGIEVAGHHGAVGDRAFGIELVENHVEVRRTGVLLFEFRFFRDQPFGVFRGEVGVGITEQSLGSGNQFGIVVAGAKSFAGIGWGGHGVDIGIIGKTGVGMVIEGGNVFNLWKEAVVDFLYVGAGEWARLGGGERCGANKNCTGETAPELH